MSDEPNPLREPHPSDDNRPLRERYRGPWRIDEIGGSSFAVRCGQRNMAFVYYRTDAEGRTESSLTRAEALTMARAIVGLSLVRKQAGCSTAMTSEALEIRAIQRAAKQVRWLDEA